MKKTLLFMGMVIAPVSMAAAKTITFDTPVEWNSSVIERALNKAGFVGSSDAKWDVRVTHERILAELLKRKTFSLKDATQVCLNKCNMSDFLKNGRGASHKKCPELCDGFIKSVISENNKQTSIPKANGQNSVFSDLEDEPIKVCHRLMQDAQKFGISYPVLCGGTCKAFGDDVVTITDLIKTKEYKVNDFCDGEMNITDKDYYYIINQSGAKNVTDISQSQRVLKLREIQTTPLTDYMNEKDKQTKVKAANDYQKRVEKNGYCKEVVALGDYVSSEWVETKGGLKNICQRAARKYAQSHACKLRNFYVLDSWSGWVAFKCIVNGDEANDGYSTLVNNLIGDSFITYINDRESSFYQYSPSYNDCVATFNESDCLHISQGQYK